MAGSNENDSKSQQLSEHEFQAAEGARNRRYTFWGAVIVAVLTVVGTIVAAVISKGPDAKASGPTNVCTELTKLEWAGTECTPPVAAIALGSCSKTKDLEWLSAQIGLLHNQLVFRLPEPLDRGFKLHVSANLVTLSICPRTDSDEECARSTFKLGIGFSSMHEDRDGGLRLFEKGKPIKGPVFLDKGGSVWCRTVAGRLEPVSPG